MGRLSLLVGAAGKDKELGFGMSFLVALLFSPLIGIVIVLISKPNKYKKYIEIGKLAEYKGNNKGAIDNYMSALYHLEKDFTPNKTRHEVITSIKKKITSLEGKIS